MTDRLKVIVGGAVAVVAFDAVAAFASRQFGFAYANASAGSYLLYGVIGFLAARNAQASPVLSAVVASAIAGDVLPENGASS